MTLLCEYYQKLIKPQSNMSNKVFTNKNREPIFSFYKLLLTVLIFCGYDYKFYKNIFYLKFLVKIYCLTLVSVVVYASLHYCENDFSQIWALLEYAVSVIYIFCIYSQTKQFFQKFVIIDLYLRIKVQYYYRTKYRIIAFTITTWLVRLAYSILYCHTYVCYNVLPLFIVRQYSLLSLDLNRVWRCVLFDGIRYRIKMLRIRLEEDQENNYYLYVNNYKSIKEHKIRFCMYLYRNIADGVDLIFPELQILLFLSVAGSLPKLISNVYHIIRAVEGHEPITTLGYITMNAIQICLLLFTPFVVVEYYSLEVEKIRQFLMHKLIDERNSPDKEDIELFLRYTEIRPFKFRIFRMIPINISLPLELINICITYVIVLINYNH